MMLGFDVRVTDRQTGRLLGYAVALGCGPYPWDAHGVDGERVAGPFATMDDASTYLREDSAGSKP